MEMEALRTAAKKDDFKQLEAQIKEIETGQEIVAAENRN